VASRPQGRHARVVGLALWGSATILVGAALAVALGVLPVDDDLRITLAAVLGTVAAVDLVIGFWFFRSSLSS